MVRWFGGAWSEENVNNKEKRMDAQVVGQVGPTTVVFLVIEVCEGAVGALRRKKGDCAE